MTNEEYNIKESGYDQKAFLQIRLHELLLTTDKMNFESARMPVSMQGTYQRTIFQNLSSVFSTIYSKLTPTEQTKGKEERQKIITLFQNTPFSKQGYDAKTGKYGTLYSYQAISIISEALFNFRFLLEDMMDKHGFNPSKKDNTTSIVD
jgi:hypothetical protein